jgi:hypothetical protein
MDDTKSRLIRQQRPGEWTWLDNAVINQITTIGMLPFAAYCVLAKHASSQDQDCYPAVDTIAAAIGRNESTARRALRMLESHGLIATTRQKKSNGGDSSNLYTLLSTPPMNRQSPVPGADWHQRHPLPVNGARGGLAAMTDKPDPIEPDPLKPDPTNHEEQANALLSAKADANATQVDARLLLLIEKYNSLPKGIIPKQTSTNPVSPKLVTRYRTALKTPELREALADPDRIVEALRNAKFAHGKSWASLLGLLSVNKAGEYKLVQLLNGAYNDHGNRSHQPVVSSDRFDHDPRNPIPGSL